MWFNHCVKEREPEGRLKAIHHKGKQRNLLTLIYYNSIRIWRNHKVNRRWPLVSLHNRKGIFDFLICQSDSKERKQISWCVFVFVANIPEYYCRMWNLFLERKMCKLVHLTTTSFPRHLKFHFCYKTPSVSSLGMPSTLFAFRRL
jgi:hypothetical protein